MVRVSQMDSWAPKVAHCVMFLTLEVGEIIVPLHFIMIAVVFCQDVVRLRRKGITQVSIHILPPAQTDIRRRRVIVKKMLVDSCES